MMIDYYIDNLSRNEKEIAGKIKAVADVQTKTLKDKKGASMGIDAKMKWLKTYFEEEIDPSRSIPTQEEFNEDMYGNMEVKVQSYRPEDTPKY